MGVTSLLLLATNLRREVSLSAADPVLYAVLKVTLSVIVYLSSPWKLCVCVDGGKRNKWCQKWDSLASKVAGYKGTMVDSDSRDSEKPEGS